MLLHGPGSLEHEHRAHCTPATRHSASVCCRSHTGEHNSLFWKATEEDFLKNQLGEKFFPTFYCLMRLERAARTCCQQSLYRTHTEGGWHLHHVVATVPVDDIHRGEDLLPHRGRRQGKGRLSLEEVRHEEYLGAQRDPNQSSTSRVWGRHRPRERRRDRLLAKAAPNHRERPQRPCHSV